ERWVVEAAQWQPALQAARALRGDSLEMHGFSVELLDDGYRAIDPQSMVRYVVRRAPDGTPITDSQPGKASKRPSQYPTAKQGAALNGDSGGAVAPAAPTAPSADGASTEKAGSPAAPQAQRIAALLDIGGTANARSRSAPPGPPSVSQPPPTAPRPVADSAAS